MDGDHFDALAKRLDSRRTALGGLLAGAILTLDATARGKNTRRKHKEKDRHTAKGRSKNRRREQARVDDQAEMCWRAGACIPKKGANISRCDLAGYSPTSTLDCTGCNSSRANLRGANLRNANLTKANLSGACLIGADLTGAIIARNTNLANAIFCNTTMPDGEPNNSGCNAGTACCTPCTVTCPAGKVPNPVTCECECPPPACTGVRIRNPETCACECPPPPNFNACFNTPGCNPVTTIDGCDLCGKIATCNACPSDGCPGEGGICVLGCAITTPVPVCTTLCPGF